VLLLDDDDELPDQPEEGESQLVAELGDDGLRAIDEALRRYTRGTWLKVARVVADAMEAGGFATSEDGPIDLHVRRVVALVDAGMIEAQGDVRGVNQDSCPKNRYRTADAIGLTRTSCLTGLR
jgi:hypothetical protein